MLSFKSTLKAAPLCCCLLLVAAEDECTIRIIGPEPDVCVELEEFCPDLVCDEYVVNDDGCELCECADPTDPSECRSDADCGPDQFCAFVDACLPCADDSNAPCDVVCEQAGVCVDRTDDPCANLDCPPGMWCEAFGGQAQCIGEPGCYSDWDCEQGESCVFGDNCWAGPDGLVACTGQCVPTGSGCANVRCEEGTHCEETAAGPACIRDEGECQADSDCGPNQHCEVICTSDPSCPECDRCLMVGICIDDGCPALCGPGSECVVSSDGTIGCVPVEPRCYSDQDCAAGQRCNANEICLPPAECDDPTVGCPDVCTGFCEAPTCQDDSQCAANEVCVIESSCDPCDPNGSNCLMPCFAEGRCQAI